MPVLEAALKLGFFSWPFSWSCGLGGAIHVTHLHPPGINGAPARIIAEQKTNTSLDVA